MKEDIRASSYELGFYKAFIVGCEAHKVTFRIESIQTRFVYIEETIEFTHDTVLTTPTLKVITLGLPVKLH
jgi:hypothetical protein